MAGSQLDFEFGFRGHDYCSSCRASLTSSGVGAVPWNLGLFSMNETPLPLTVWATMQVGWPLVASASASAAWMAGEVVAVDLDGVPAEGAPFVGQRLDFHDVLYEAVELDAVVVHDGDHVVDLVESAGHGGFPDLAFLDFAVAQQHVGAGRAAVEPRREPHSERQREPFAQRAGGGFQAGMKRMSGWPW